MNNLITKETSSVTAFSIVPRVNIAAIFDALLPLSLYGQLSLSQCAYKFQCLRNYTSTSAFADDSYFMVDVEAKFLHKNVLNSEHQPKCCYWPMLMNIVSQTLKFSNKVLHLVTATAFFRQLIRVMS